MFGIGENFLFMSSALEMCTYLLIYSTEQSPSSEANRFTASQEIPAFYGTRKCNTAFTNARHLSLF